MTSLGEFCTQISDKINVCVCVCVCVRVCVCVFHSLALHPDRGMVATAQIGKAPFICVWDCITMETVSILQGGHERGIAAVGFSGNGNVSVTQGGGGGGV